MSNVGSLPGIRGHRRYVRPGREAEAAAEAAAAAADVAARAAAEVAREAENSNNAGSVGSSSGHSNGDDSGNDQHERIAAARAPESPASPVRRSSTNAPGSITRRQSLVRVEYLEEWKEE